MPKIFLSHASRDADVAGRIRKALNRLGVATFMPSEDVVPGENWRMAVKRSIADADAVVLIVGSAQLGSENWLSYEAGAASALGKPLLVLMSDANSVDALAADLVSDIVLPFDPNNPELVAHTVVEQLRATA